MQKNILILTEAIPGGEWIATQRLIMAVKNSRPNYNFYLIAFSKKRLSVPEFDSSCFIKYSRAKKPFGFLKRTVFDFLKLYRKLKKTYARSKIDSTISTHYLTTLSALIAKPSNNHLIYYFHGRKSAYSLKLFDLKYNEIIIKILERLALYFSKTIIVPSKFSKEYLLKFLSPFVRKAKIVVVPNFIPKNFGNIDTHSVSALKKRLKIKKNEKVILYCGRIAKFKGLKNLITAFSLSPTNLNVRLIISSPSFRMDVEVYKDIKKIIRKGSIKNIDFCFDIGEKNIRAVYKIAHLLVLPSETEQSPISILEALVSKTPVIATPVGNLPEIINRIDKNLLIKNNQPTAIIQSIKYFFSLSADETEKIKSKGYNVANDYGPKESVTRFTSILEK